MNAEGFGGASQAEGKRRAPAPKWAAAGPAELVLGRARRLFPLELPELFEL